MEQDEIKKILTDISTKLDEVKSSQERTQTHAKWVLWITIALVVLPAVGLLFAVPQFMATYDALGNL